MPASGGGEVIQLTSGPAIDVFPAWSPDGTQIAFSSNREGSINLWTVPAAGGEPTRITADEDSVTSRSPFWGMSSVDWSPDGTELAFSSSKTGNDDIWIIPVSGGGPARQLTSGPADDGNPEWSPDGTQISFSSNRSGNVDIWIVPALGGFPRQVTDHPSNDWWNSWSPDGRWLAFVSERTGNHDIWIVSASGGTTVPITVTQDYENGPRWTADGDGISFHRRVMQGELWVMSASGSEPSLLVDEVASGFGGNPAWSPDGKEIAFIAAGPEGRDIWKIPTSGGARLRLTHNGMVTPTVAGLSFSPDGRQIAFASSRGGKSDVWTMPASGGNAHQVTLSGRVAWMSFSPDSRRIVFDSNSDIWVVPTSGGVPTRLIDWPMWDIAPAWSPEGGNIAFASQRTQTGEVADGNWHIWLVPESGAEATYLTAGMWPSWSPDGTQILFAHNDDIWKIPAIGGTPTLQLQTPESENWPRYSPDGSQILFMRSDTSIDANIWIADVSGMTNALSLTNSGNTE